MQRGKELAQLFNQWQWKLHRIDSKEKLNSMNEISNIKIDITCRTYLFSLWKFKAVFVAMSEFGSGGEAGTEGIEACQPIHFVFSTSTNYAHWLRGILPPSTNANPYNIRPAFFIRRRKKLSMLNTIVYRVCMSISYYNLPNSRICNSGTSSYVEISETLTGLWYDRQCFITHARKIS